MQCSTVSRFFRSIAHLRRPTRSIVPPSKSVHCAPYSSADGITAELLKGAEKPTSEALHKIITNVWSTGRVPAKWKEGIIVSLYKGKGSQSDLYYMELSA